MSRRDDELSVGSIIGTLLAMTVVFLFVVTACVPNDTATTPDRPGTATEVPLP